MKTPLHIVVILLTIYSCTKNDNVKIIWQKSPQSSGLYHEQFHTICKSNDKNYVIFGSLSHEKNFLTVTDKLSILKINELGEEIWRTSISTMKVKGKVHAVQKNNGDGHLIFFTGNLIDGREGLNIFEIDANGNVILEKQHTLPLVLFHLKSVLITSTEEYILMGHGGNYEKLGGYFMRINQNGNIIGQKWISAVKGDSYFNDIIQTGENEFLLAGYREFENNAPHKALFTKTDSKGNVVWEKVIATVDKDYNFSSTSAKSIVKCKDEGYIFTGWGSGEPCAVKFDNSGEIVWTRVIEQKEGISLRTGGRKIVKNNDNFLVINEGSYSPRRYKSKNNDLIVITEIDNKGNINWDFVIHEAPAGASINIIDSHQKGYLMVCTMIHNSKCFKFSTNKN